MIQVPTDRIPSRMIMMSQIDAEIRIQRANDSPVRKRMQSSSSDLFVILWSQGAFFIWKEKQGIRSGKNNHLESSLHQGPDSRDIPGGGSINRLLLPVLSFRYQNGEFEILERAETLETTSWRDTWTLDCLNWKRHNDTRVRMKFLWHNDTPNGRMVLTFGIFIAESIGSHITQSKDAFGARVDKIITVKRMEFSCRDDFR